MSSKRIHPDIPVCKCGCEWVEETSDGVMSMYDCADCGKRLGEFSMGPEP